MVLVTRDFPFQIKHLFPAGHLEIDADTVAFPVAVAGRLGAARAADLLGPASVASGGLASGFAGLAFGVDGGEFGAISVIWTLSVRPEIGA